MNILNEIPPLDWIHHAVFSFLSPPSNYSVQCESWNILLMGFTARVPWAQTLRLYFQLRPYLCWDRQGESHIWATEFCHTCKWGPEAKWTLQVPTACRSQCVRESNAAQTAGTRDQLNSCTVWWTTLISVSTLMDKQIYFRTGFLLSSVKNESYINLLKWAIYFIQAVWSPRELEYKLRWGVSQPPKGARMQSKGLNVYG